MAKPKLALIPAAYGSKFYSILPSNGVGDFDFSRSSVATRINPEGLIETVTSGQSRLDYPLVNGVQKGCPHYLLEPSRTNLLTYSEDFATGWAKFFLTLTAESTTSPDGALTGTKVQITNDNTAGLITNNEAITSGLTYTQTVYAKAGTYGYLHMTGSTGFNSSRYQSYDLVNGVLINGSGVIESSIENVGNGWYRCTYTDVSILSTSGRIVIGVSNNSGRLGGSGLSSGDNIYLWGAQLEVGSFSTSYIPTTTTQVTRVAETANGAGNASTFNDSEGVLILASKGFSDLQTSSGYIQLSKNGESSSTNSLIIQHRNNGSLRIYANGFATANIIFNLNIDFSQNHKIAVLYKLNGYKLFIDGFEQSLFGTPTQAVFSGLDNLAFDLRGALSWNGQIKQLQYFDSALAGTQIEQLTSWTSFRDMAEAQSYTIQ